ncbi:DeoR/GlpR family DNA-binding transcription regulator [Lapidilactobacillus gannanensis]|uniref:DeoR/GlpR family DNA-binding transcription regulator n=2 Tax=Lapidilactobacillus gannanensis TaxID=2486002 RepID=A0ABW4BQ74_9LACO
MTEKRLLFVLKAVRIIHEVKLMLTEQRYQIILHRLTQQPICKINELVHLTDASESTIRRDLDELEKQGLLERIHGGARLLVHLTADRNQTEREQLHRSDKEQVAAYVAQHYLHNQQFLYLDAGTTVQEIIPYLKDFHDITVVTNSIVTAGAVAETGIATYLTGGKLKANTQALVGMTSVQTLSKYHFDLALLGVNAITPGGDLLTPDVDEADVKQQAQRQAKSAIVLTDASKFSEIAFATFGNLHDFTAVVTTALPANLREQYHQKNIKELSK